MRKVPTLQALSATLIVDRNIEFPTHYIPLHLQDDLRSINSIKNLRATEKMLEKKLGGLVESLNYATMRFRYYDVMISETNLVTSIERYFDLYRNVVKWFENIEKVQKHIKDVKEEIMMINVEEEFFLLTLGDVYNFI